MTRDALSPSDVRSLLREHGIRPSRALGQNFLADANTARRIVRLAGIERGDRVLEIGPGLGSLTLALAQAGARVHALELDRHLVPVLEAVLGAAPNVTAEAGDALTWDYAGRLRDGPWSCVSNLPYNVATPVVARVLEEAPTVTRLLVMVQREVGERLAAAPRTKAYGAVTVKVAYHATARIVGAVPPTVFVPRPNVDSALVQLERRATPPVEVPSYAAMFELVGAGFAHRRKMLRRALASALGDRTEVVLERAGVAPTARAEELDLEAWAAVARSAAE
ncbi:MAG: 16S rRNA (adenine(1518)-N(6)/adenine(1519)-N(6))-dimethyltransferase RsmA [Acidimicrobiia bacterium]